MTSLLFQIQIPKRSMTCSTCLKPFSPGTDYYSLLSEDENEEKSRADFCPECWHQKSDQMNLKRDAKYWKSKVPLKKLGPVLPEEKNTHIFECLKKSLEDDSQEAKEDAFVLALYLARRRLISLRKEVKEEDGSILQLYEDLETEEMLSIHKIHLAKEQIETVQERIAKKVNEKS